VKLLVVDDDGGLRKSLSLILTDAGHEVLLAQDGAEGLAVAAQDTALLTRIPGIGKKTAERLLLELKDKLGVEASISALPAGQTRSATSDVLNALLALGYNEREALAATKQIAPGLSVSEGIRQALKSLSRT